MEAATHPKTAPVTASVRGRVTLFSARPNPVLEVGTPRNVEARVPFVKAGPGRTEGEHRWLAEPTLPATGLWHFRIDQGHGVYDAPLQANCYTTALRELWLQDKQLFGYAPVPHLSPARVDKLEAFEGSLATRALYVYLPRGYDEQPSRRYPVIYLHDGQNVFEAFVADSFAGSWRADETASRLIAAGQMQEAIIVGVSNGGEARMAEYLPPYTHYHLHPKRRRGHARRRAPTVIGRANKTASYYQHEVAAHITENYRVLAGREHTATVGSSMGGLFSWYLAFEHPEFARNHAVMSSTFWITSDGKGKLEALTRLQQLPKRDLRLWLDSGEGKDRPGGDDDNKYCTLEAREALLAAGYEEGEDFVYYLDEGARHQESDWATRLDRVFRFLLPAYLG